MNRPGTQAGIFRSTWRRKFFLESPFASACICSKIHGRPVLANALMKKGLKPNSRSCVYGARVLANALMKKGLKPDSARPVH